MALTFYNTLTKKKEKFEPISIKEVGIYTCGPTVYNFAHVGNMRAYIFSDILVRYLKFLGYEVNHVMNITDVGHLTSDADTGEDKIEKEAEKEKKSAWDVAKTYEKAFLEDVKSLNIQKPTIVARATDYIKEQIKFIQDLEKKGFTYVIDDGVYFDSTRIKDYGKLANLDIANLEAGKRVEIKGKKHKTDFALWKFSPKDKKRDMEWDSPWGKGFPGWHIECSAISLKFLGFPFDIHTGGIDHVPVHHTNEIAQGEALTGKNPVKFWMHSEFLVINESKMAKSKGNIVRVTELGVEPLAYRMLVLQTHYRDPLNFTDEALKAADNALKRLRDYVRQLKSVQNSAEGEEKTLDMGETAFTEAMDDDLNTPKALANIFQIANNYPTAGVSGINAEKILKYLLRIDQQILGLDLEKQISVPEKVQKLASERQSAREKTDWQKADEIRNEVEELGYYIEDTDTGPVIKEK